MRRPERPADPLICSAGRVARGAALRTVPGAGSSQCTLLRTMPGPLEGLRQHGPRETVDLGGSDLSACHRDFQSDLVFPVQWETELLSVTGERALQLPRQRPSGRKFARGRVDRSASAGTGAAWAAGARGLGCGRERRPSGGLGKLFLISLFSVCCSGLP